jgi:HPt (histidine-containing phosphotransfer) domain-containing protein
MVSCHRLEWNTVPLDCSHLIAEFHDQPELIVRLLQVFIAEARKDIEGLIQAFRDNDFPQAIRMAHRLKGAASTTGAEPVRASAAHIESLTRQGSTQEAMEHMSCLEGEFERFSIYISNLCHPE